MVDGFLKLPFWLQIIITGLLASGVIIFYIKFLKSEKLHVGKDGVDLVDNDNVKEPEKNIIAEEVKKDVAKS